jgi:predicted nuclease of restriction endonuclease-like RecB superfamily
MLTTDLAMNRVRGNRIEPRVINPADKNHLQMASDLVAIFTEHQGEQRAELDRELEEYVGTGTDYKILRGLIKLLLDECEFETGSAILPSEIRRALFLKARLHHPVSARETTRTEVIKATAAELNCTVAEIEASLYADLWDNQRLISFNGMDARALLDRYNLAQAQALLYRSTEMQLCVAPQEATGYRKLFDAIKAYRLIHTIKGNQAKGYDIRLDGPVSMFHQSQKYGIQMAVFLPALLLCDGWRMKAEIVLKTDRRVIYELESRNHQLHSHYLDDVSYKPALEEKLTANWARSASAWQLQPGKEVIDLGQSAFIPDFIISRTDGRRLYLELLGFWTPRHLDERIQEFARAGFTDYLLAVSDELRGSREKPLHLPTNVIVYKSALNVAAIQMAIEQLCGTELAKE